MFENKLKGGLWKLPGISACSVILILNSNATPNMHLSSMLR